MNCSECGAEIIHGAGYVWNGKKLCQSCFDSAINAFTSSLQSTNEQQKL